MEKKIERVYCKCCGHTLTGDALNVYSEDYCPFCGDNAEIVEVINGQHIALKRVKRFQPYNVIALRGGLEVVNASWSDFDICITYSIMKGETYEVVASNLSYDDANKYAEQHTA